MTEVLPTVMVVNAGPLISLGRIARLDLLRPLAPQMLTTGQVRAEVLHRHDAAAALIRDCTWLTIAEQTLGDEPHRWRIDAGEASVIACALTRPGCGVVIDDRAGRRAARAQNLLVIGTLGVLLWNRRLNLISAVTPLVRDLLQVGIHLHHDDITRALASLGEPWP